MDIEKSLEELKTAAADKSVSDQEIVKRFHAFLDSIDLDGLNDDQAGRILSGMLSTLKEHRPQISEVFELFLQLMFKIDGL